MNLKKFKAPNGQPNIRVALLSGHACVITQEYIELGPIYWAEAYAAGAISSDMTEDKSVKQARAEHDAEVAKEEAEFFDFLKSKLQLIHDKPVGFIDGNGFPLYRKVTSLVKKAVKKDLIIKAWEEVKSENEEQEESE